jgi:hypothetical protein
MFKLLVLLTIFGYLVAALPDGLHRIKFPHYKLNHNQILERNRRLRSSFNKHSKMIEKQRSPGRLFELGMPGEFMVFLKG